MIEVIHNIFPTSFEDMVLDVLTSENFPWYYKDSTVSKESKVILDSSNTIETSQFIHQFCNNDEPNSSFFPMIQTMKFLLEQQTGKTITKIARTKANLLPVYKFYPEDCHHTIHIDEQQGHMSFLYYVNDSDGDTLFFQNGKETLRQNPKKGTGILFDSNEYHCSTPPKENARIVINMVFQVARL